MALKRGEAPVSTGNGSAFRGKITDCKYSIYVGVKVGKEVRLLPNCALGFDPRQAKTGDQIMQAILAHMVSHSKPKAEGFDWQPLNLFGKTFYVALVEKTLKQTMSAEEIDASWG